MESDEIVLNKYWNGQRNKRRGQYTIVLLFGNTPIWRNLVFLTCPLQLLVCVSSERYKCYIVDAYTRSRSPKCRKRFNGIISGKNDDVFSYIFFFCPSTLMSHVSSTPRIMFIVFGLLLTSWCLFVKSYL